MKVKVNGHGVINFPDSMTDEEVRGVLRQFEPKKDDTMERLLKELVTALNSQKPKIVTDTRVEQIEVPTIVEKTVVQKVEVPVREKSAWHFQINREDGLITEIYAEPVE